MIHGTSLGCRLLIRARTCPTAETVRCWMPSRTLAPIQLGSLLSSISELLARSWSVLLRDATAVDCGKLRAFAAACDTTVASRDGNGRPLAGCSCWSAYLLKVHYLCTRRR